MGLFQSGRSVEGRVASTSNKWARNASRLPRKGMSRSTHDQRGSDSVGGKLIKLWRSSCSCAPPWQPRLRSVRNRQVYQHPGQAEKSAQPRFFFFLTQQQSSVIQTSSEVFYESALEQRSKLRDYFTNGLKMPLSFVNVIYRKIGTIQ